MATKKAGSAGRFGARYGLRIRRKINEVDKKLKAKHTCTSCLKKSMKRLAAGIWYCTKCKFKVAGKAYEL